MIRTRNLGAAAILAVLAGAAAANADPNVLLPVGLTSTGGILTNTSVPTLDNGPAINWTVLLNSATADVLTPFGPTQINLVPAFGILATDLQGAGASAGISPQTLWTHNYSFTPVGNIVPAYSFTLTFDLLAGRQTRMTMSNVVLGSMIFQGLPTTFTGINVGMAAPGSVATAQVVPAPGAMALMGAGGLAAFRRRRKN